MAKPSMIRILIVDDHPMVLKGLTATITPEPDMTVVASAATGKDAVRLFREHRPDVTIMDLSLTPDMTGTQAIEAIRKELPAARVIVLSAYKGDEDIFQAVQAGASCYLLKEKAGDDLIRIIREVHAGGNPMPLEVGQKLAERLRHPSLSEREIDVLQLIARGLRNKEIAETLSISPSTVQGHVKNILSKLNVHDRPEAVHIAIQRGIIRGSV